MTIFYLMVIFLVQVAVECIKVDVSAPGLCPPGFFDECNDFCLRVSFQIPGTSTPNQLKTFEDAKTECRAWNASLVSIRNELDQQCIEKHTEKSVSNLWIGLHLDPINKSVWKWMDPAVAYNYTNWQPGQPDNWNSLEACVEFVGQETIGGWKHGKWNDVRCNADAKGYICEKLKVNVVSSPSTYENKGCPINCINCVRFRDSCYYFSSPNVSMNWLEANSACQQIYQNLAIPTSSSNLVSIHDQLEQDFVVAHLGTSGVNRWIGLSGDKLDQDPLFYTDQTPVGYKNWNSGEPDKPSVNLVKCVMLYGSPAKAGLWNDEYCHLTMGYVCKMKKDISVIVSEETDPLYKPGFTYLEGVGFAIVAMPNSGISGNDAQNTCAALHGRSASIVNIYEKAFVHTIFAQKSNFQTEGRQKAWLGAKIRNNQLKWDAGCFAKYNNISDFYTSNYSDGSCVTMDNTAKWLVQQCSENSQYVICEHRIIECIKADVSAPGLCPPGFSDECNDFCLRVSFQIPGTSTPNQLKTFEDAKTECRAWNASLVSIRNELDQQCIEKHTEKSVSNLWIGLHLDPINKSVWKWMDPAVAYNYTNWQPGQPDNFTFEACVEFIGEEYGWKHGMWNDVRCNAGTKGYICEKPKVSVVNVNSLTLIYLLGVMLLAILMIVAVVFICRWRRIHQNSNREDLYVGKTPDIELQQIPQPMLNDRLLPLPPTPECLYNHIYEEIGRRIENPTYFGDPIIRS